MIETITKQEKQDAEAFLNRTHKAFGTIGFQKIQTTQTKTTKKFRFNPSLSLHVSKIAAIREYKALYSYLDFALTKVLLSLVEEEQLQTLLQATNSKNQPTSMDNKHGEALINIAKKDVDNILTKTIKGVDYSIATRRELALNMHLLKKPLQLRPITDTNLKAIVKYLDTNISNIEVFVLPASYLGVTDWIKSLISELFENTEYYGSKKDNRFRVIADYTKQLSFCSVLALDMAIQDYISSQEGVVKFPTIEEIIKLSTRYQEKCSNFLCNIAFISDLIELIELIEL